MTPVDHPNQTPPAREMNVHVTGRRVVATLLDSVVLSVVTGALNTLFGTNGDVSGYDMTQMSFGGAVLILVVTALYFILMEGLLGRTLGKMVTGIRIVDEATGTKLNVGQAFTRTVLRLVDGLIAYLVGFIIVMNSDRRRRLGDIAAKTLVVRA
jgi:uncharacterized RDD family membrane protein YckC